MKQKICLFVFGIALFHTTSQEVSAGINKWWSLLPAIATYGLWSMREPEKRLPWPVRPFVPDSIQKELSSSRSRTLPLPPKSDAFGVQGGWDGFINGNIQELVVDCRSGQPETCSVYWNCPSCYESFEKQEWYKGQAKTRLGEVNRISVWRPGGVTLEEFYKGTVYNPDKFMKGQLEKVRMIIYLQANTGNVKITCTDPVTFESVFYVRWCSSNR